MIARTILTARIDEVREALRRARLLRHLAVVLVIGILVRGAFLIASWQGVRIPRHIDRWSMLALIALGLFAYLKGRRSIWSDRDIARLIEQKHPTLDSLLLTAIEHESPAAEPAGYLHERLIDHALARSATQNWPVTVADAPYRRALTAAWIAALAFVAIFLAPRPGGSLQKSAIKNPPSAVPSSSTFSATLTPGDTEVERNSRLIIEARFEGPVPADATLVLSDTDGKERDRQPMRLTVDGQVYGGLIAKVERDTRYHVEFAGEKSQQHTLTVYDFPALVRSDVIVTPPAYAKLPSKETKNTQKVTALEGSKIAWKIKVNKPLLAPGATTTSVSPFTPHLTAAELFGEDKTIIPLTPSATDPTLLEGTLDAKQTQKYRLHLVDEADRANKNPPWFTVTVQSNQLAKIEVVFPKRDLQVSSIQELPVEAKVSDDLSVLRSGAVFSINGNTHEIPFTHAPTAPQKKQDVQTQLALEKHGTQPRQLVSYYFWAEDTGPQGEIRRNMSDMFFADVRHFEDIFREAEAPPPEPGQPKPKAAKLVELQKQVVNATWKLIRDTNGGRSMDSAAPDVGVVHQSQGLAMEQTKEAMEEVEDAEMKQALTEAWKSMKDALDPLNQAAEEKKRSPLNQALTFEQSALEWLHRAQSREHQVMSSDKAMAGQTNNENQIMDLELKQKEQRYEEEKAATEEQTAEQQENLQVLNRLKELARRQEALAEKMKELQNQLAKAKTEEEKQELENQLKRLQAEQEKLLSDLDELKERMENPENAQTMAEAKEQLEQTREKVNEAAEQLKNQQLTEATNAATRAQRELEKMQEDFRQKTSKKFADEVKQLKQQAQQAAEAQKKISQAIENQKPESEGEKDLSQALKDQAQARQIAEQQENVEKLLNNMRQLSEQAEQSEPILHKNLYDAVRKAQTSGLEENLQETRDQLRYGTQAEAQEADRKASNAIEDLKKGVEKAAESVLGSETEALRVAKSELDKLIEEAKKEEANGNAQKPGEGEPKGQASSQSEKPGEGQKPGEGEPKGQTASKGEKPGEGQKPGEGEPKGQTASKGAKPGEGQKTGEGEPKGEKPGPGAAKGSQMAQSDQPSSESPQPGDQPAEGEGKQPGQGQSKGQNSNRQTADSSDPSAPNTARGPTTDRDSDNDRRRPQINGGAVSEALFFDDTQQQPDNTIFTGDGYDRWSDRLRNVEELLNNPELRNETAKILDRARELRVDLKRSNEAPQVTTLNARITQPLIELRDRVIEELSKKDAGKNLAPVDRDPVPAEFRDLVKRYYKELGAGK
ncbi:MAG: hypothetical protein IPK32_05750 [Verrucomicrobiaceae bacterium]|nr:hypothetical protein [Verrucomicrobiaceae bacterium]